VQTWTALRLTDYEHAECAEVDVVFDLSIALQALKRCHFIYILYMEKEGDGAVQHRYIYSTPDSSITHQE